MNCSTSSPKLDAIIIVKRIDKTVTGLVAKARLYDVPVFLDLCDDMLAPGYVKNEFGVNLMRFLGMAPFLAGVTVPSAEMADRIQGYCTRQRASRTQSPRRSRHRRDLGHLPRHATNS